MTGRPRETPQLARRRELAQLASDRSGVFTAAAARALGMTSSSLAYHSRTGTIERLGHGVYRIADFPSSPRQPLIAAAAALGKDAVVSHESALQLYGISDIAPSRLHFTVPRARRYVTVPAADVELHTTTRPFASGDVVQHEGFRATSLPRSIVDAARAHTAPEQIVMAVRQGFAAVSSLVAMSSARCKEHRAEFASSSKRGVPREAES